jgi:hypothetical protein
MFISFTPQHGAKANERNDPDPRVKDIPGK